MFVLESLLAGSADIFKQIKKQGKRLGKHAPKPMALSWIFAVSQTSCELLVRCQTSERIQLRSSSQPD